MVMAGDTPLGKPPFGSAGPPRASATSSTLPAPKPAPRVVSPSVSSSAPTSPASAPAAKATPEQRTQKCPKCGATAREVARFCQRCHMTLRFSCPACKNEQRTGGTCEKCGVDFLKYIVAVVDAKKQ